MSAPLIKPRWLNGPKICAAENLPAFESEKALSLFMAANAPSCKVVKKWQCEACGHFHAYTIAPDPAGASSGSGRGSKQGSMDDWKRFFAAESPGEFVTELGAIEKSRLIGSLALPGTKI